MSFLIEFIGVTLVNTLTLFSSVQLHNTVHLLYVFLTCVSGSECLGVVCVVFLSMWVYDSMLVLMHKCFCVCIHRGLAVSVLESGHRVYLWRCECASSGLWIVCCVVSALRTCVYCGWLLCMHLVCGSLWPCIWVGGGSHGICVAGCVSRLIWAYVYCEHIVVLWVYVCISESVCLRLCGCIVYVRFCVCRYLCGLNLPGV